MQEIFQDVFRLSLFGWEEATRSALTKLACAERLLFERVSRGASSRESLSFLDNCSCFNFPALFARATPRYDADLRFVEGQAFSFLVVRDDCDIGGGHSSSYQQASSLESGCLGLVKNAYFLSHTVAMHVCICLMLVSAHVGMLDP